MQLAWRQQHVEHKYGCQTRDPSHHLVQIKRIRSELILFLPRVNTHVGTMIKFVAAFLLLLGGVSAAPASSNDSMAAHNLEKRATGFWYANMDHTGQYRGYAPDLDPDYTYPVFKSVNAGDGASIQDAINSGSSGTRHGSWLASQPRVGSTHTHN